MYSWENVEEICYPRDACHRYEITHADPETPHSNNIRNPPCLGGKMGRNLCSGQHGQNSECPAPRVLRKVSRLRSFPLWLMKICLRIFTPKFTAGVCWLKRSEVIRAWHPFHWGGEQFSYWQQRQPLRFLAASPSFSPRRPRFGQVTRTQKQKHETTQLLEFLNRTDAESLPE